MQQRKKKRVGRGPGSGIGKTSRRGHKGSGQRGHRLKPWFEGGQTPFFKRLPKVGIVHNRKPMAELTILKLMAFIKAGRVDCRTKIDMHTIQQSNLLHIKHGVKLVATGEQELNIPVHLEVSHATEEAVEAVERAGGSVKFIYMNKRTLDAHLHPHKHQILPRRLPLPQNPRKAQIYIEQIPDKVSGKPSEPESFKLPSNPLKWAWGKGQRKNRKLRRAGGAL